MPLFLAAVLPTGRVAATLAPLDRPVVVHLTLKRQRYSIILASDCKSVPTEWHKNVVLAFYRRRFNNEGTKDPQVIPTANIKLNSKV